VKAPGRVAVAPADPLAAAYRVGDGLNTTEPRAAEAQGTAVKDRGRVPAELVIRFKSATGQ